MASPFSRRPKWPPGLELKSERLRWIYLTAADCIRHYFEVEGRFEDSLAANIMDREVEEVAKRLMEQANDQSERILIEGAIPRVAAEGVRHYEVAKRRMEQPKSRMRSPVAMGPISGVLKLLLLKVWLYTRVSLVFCSLSELLVKGSRLINDQAQRDMTKVTKKALNQWQE